MSSVSFLNCGFLFCLQSNTMWEPERPKKKLKSQYSPYEMPSYTPLPSSLLEHNSDSLQEANNESLLSDISDNGDISQWLDEEEALMDQRLDHMPVGNEGVPQQASLNQPATSLTTPEEVVKYMQHSVLSPDCTPEIRRDYQLQQQWSVVPTDSSGDLRSTMEIAMPYRNIFNFVEFNALQSECLDHAYHTNENLVISAPTGSGKTCIIEMAIVHTLSIASKKDVKIIYMAPTKSLCSERARDWEIKFQPLGATCKEYTGDTDFATAHAIKSTTIVITTPEKWDSMTRRWRDHIQLMSMVKLFIIDEVHILNEDRGAVLESCVSRMKTMDHHIRFVAISATIPNVNDIAEWLNAEALSFSEAYRPVKLNRIVYGYTFKGDNMFAFEKMLDWKLLDVIKKHSKDKPVLIFCSTRKSAQSSCEILLKMAKKQGIECFSQEPENSAVLKDKKLQEFVKQGIGYHHAGLDVQDRTTIESLFLNRSIRVVATTSTLAVGVNLPTYLVIIKSTKCYQNGNLVEYSDIEILQMIGRAGRPGFESSGCAVIMTTPAMKNHYTNLVGGIAPIESRLHENLVEHMMSEICLSSITDEESQAKWLRSTFLHVRVRVNPSHYHISSLGNTRFFGPDEILQDISTKHLNDLIDANLVEKKQLQRNSKERYIPTFYGDAMAKYYIKFKTMKNIVESTHCSSIQDILYIVSKAEEFSSMRFAAGEKPFLNSLQKNPNIRYPINGKVTTTADKVFLVIQCVLGDVSLHGGAMGNSLALASFQILQHARRITKCIIDCSIHEKDAIKLKHALEFHRCLSAKMWGNSSHILRQVERIGPRMAKNLLNAGISTFEQLRKVDSSRIEVILHRNPPFGSQIKETVDMIPHFALEFQQVGKRKQARNVTLQLEVSVLNEKSFQRVKFGKGYYAQIWIEMDKHALVDFRRISAKKLQEKSQSFYVNAETSSTLTTFIAHVQSEDYVGLDVSKELIVECDPSCFSSPAQMEGLSAEPTTAAVAEETERKGVIPGDRHNVDAAKNEESEAFFDDISLDSDLWRQLDDVPTRGPSGEDDGKQMEINESKKMKAKQDNLLPAKGCKHICHNKERCKHACCKPKVVVLGEQAQGVVTGRTQPKKTSKSGVEDTAIPHKNNNNKNVGLLDSLPSPAKENLFVQNDEEDCLKLAAGTETQWPEKCTGDMVAATDGSCLQYATVKKRGMRDDACDRLWDDVGNFAFHVFNTARCVDPIEDSDIPLMPVSNASPRHNTARDKAENDVSSMTDSPSNKFSLSQWLERYTTITKADP